MGASLKDPKFFLKVIPWILLIAAATKTQDSTFWEYDVIVMSLSIFILIYTVMLIVMFRAALDGDVALIFSVIAAIMTYMSGAVMLTNPARVRTSQSEVVTGALLLAAGVIITLDIIMNYFGICKKGGGGGGGGD